MLTNANASIISISEVENHVFGKVARTGIFPTYLNKFNNNRFNNSNNEFNNRRYGVNRFNNSNNEFNNRRYGVNRFNNGNKIGNNDNNGRYSNNNNGRYNNNNNGGYGNNNNRIRNSGNNYSQSNYNSNGTNNGMKRKFMKCYNCGKEGHMARDCNSLRPEYPEVNYVQQGNVLSTVLADSGADINIIPRSLLNVDQWNVKEESNVLFVSACGSSTKSLGSISLFIKIQAITRQQVVIAAKFEIYDSVNTVILGRPYLGEINSSIDCQMNT
ncbi:hypothetical protein ACTA71_011852 [Dictyostelium dimigraforme]